MVDNFPKNATIRFYPQMKTLEPNTATEIGKLVVMMVVKRLITISIKLYKRGNPFSRKDYYQWSQKDLTSRSNWNSEVSASSIDFFLEARREPTTNSTHMA